MPLYDGVVEAPSAVASTLAGTLPDFLVWGAKGDVLTHIPSVLQLKKVCSTQG